MIPSKTLHDNLLIESQSSEHVCFKTSFKIIEFAILSRSPNECCDVPLDPSIFNVRISIQIDGWRWLLCRDAFVLDGFIDILYYIHNYSKYLHYFNF